MLSPPMIDGEAEPHDVQATVPEEAPMAEQPGSRPHRLSPPARLSR